MKRYLLLALFIAIVGLGAVFSRLAALQSQTPAKNIAQLQQERGIPVAVTRPARRAVADQLELVGSVVPYRALEVATRRVDLITSSTLVLGRRVAAGEVVARLDERTVRARLAAAEAALAQASLVVEKLRRGTRAQQIRELEAGLAAAAAAVEIADKEFARMERLQATGAITRQNAEKVIAARDQARAGLEGARQRLSLAREGPQAEDIKAAEAAQRQAEANLELARIAVEQSVITSPIAGRIDRVDHEVGEQAGDNRPLFGVVDIDRVFVHVEVPARAIARVQVGQPALVAGEQLAAPRQGQVAEVNPNADPQARTYLAKILLDNADLALRPGMFVTATLVFARHDDAMVLPRECLVEQDGKRGVYVVVASTATFLAVTTGLDDGDNVEITAGLEPAAAVVREGQADLTPQARVEVAGGGA